MAEMHTKQREILAALINWQGDELPRVSTLAARVGLADESTARYHLKALDEQGLVKRILQGKGLPQLLEVQPAGYEAAGIAEATDASDQGARELKAPVNFGVPIIPARCGFKEIGEGECAQLAMSHIFPRWRGDDLDHALIAENDSMQAPEGRAHPESIFEGDLVHGREGIAPGAHARVYIEYLQPSGQRVCALKILEKRGKVVVLKSLNPAYEPITIAARDIARCYLVLDVRGLLRGGTK